MEAAQCRGQSPGVAAPYRHTCPASLRSTCRQLSWLDLGRHWTCATIPALYVSKQKVCKGITSMSNWYYGIILVWEYADNLWTSLTWQLCIDMYLISPSESARASQLLTAGAERVLSVQAALPKSPMFQELHCDCSTDSSKISRNEYLNFRCLLLSTLMSMYETYRWCTDGHYSPPAARHSSISSWKEILLVFVEAT